MQEGQDHQDIGAFPLAVMEPPHNDFLCSTNNETGQFLDIPREVRAICFDGVGSTVLDMGTNRCLEKCLEVLAPKLPPKTQLISQGMLLGILPGSFETRLEQRSEVLAAKSGPKTQPTLLAMFHGPSGQLYWVAQNKFWCLFLKCTLRYESHLLSISAEHS